jgi:hypothetical protein
VLDGERSDRAVWRPMEASECPGCGDLVTTSTDNAELMDGDGRSWIAWQQLHDGRWLAFDMPLDVPIHECRYGGGGGTASDRVPLPTTPPAQSRPATEAPPTN